MAWLMTPDDVLAFTRGSEFLCVINFSVSPVELPAHESVLLASRSLENGLLPPDTAVWLRV